jgi:hypothetical protein
MTTQTPTREMFLRPLTFEVSSESKPNVTYRVTLPSCECPDFAYRRTRPSGPEGMFCKHLRAAFASAGSCRRGTPAASMRRPPTSC